MVRRHGQARPETGHQCDPSSLEASPTEWEQVRNKVLDALESVHETHTLLTSAHAASIRAKGELDGPWLNVPSAIALIERDKDVGPKQARALLKEAGASERVRARCLLADPVRNVIKIVPCPAKWGAHLDMRSGMMLFMPDQEGDPVAVEISQHDLRDWLRPRRGPKPGTVARYDEPDRALFPEMKRMIREERQTIYGAALKLANEGKVLGMGISTAESRARRLAKAYRAKTR
jgi:hypothetical protein